MPSLDTTDATAKEVQSEGCRLIPTEFGQDIEDAAGVCQNTAERREAAGGVQYGQVEEEEEDGYRTPTGPEHQIPEPLECPPAPRKPSSGCSVKKKRKREFYGVELDYQDAEAFLRWFITCLLTVHDGLKKKKV